MTSACSNGLVGYWEAFKVTEDGDDVTDEYLYDYKDGSCTYQSGLSLRFLPTGHAMLSSWYSEECAGEMPYMYQYGWYMQYAVQSGQISLFQGSAYDSSYTYEILACNKVRSTLRCGQTGESLEFHFRKEG